MTYHPFKFFPKNVRGRDFVVGDLHGCFTALEILLNRVDFSPITDRVFSVGDLIDRGAESSRVLEFLEKPWFYAVMGNHERMLLEASASSEVKFNWTHFNGGAWWDSIPSHQHALYRQQLSQLPLAFEVSTQLGRVGIVHADVPVGVTWSNFIKQLQDEDEMAKHALWARSRYKHLQASGLTVPVSGIDMVVFGHTPNQRIIQSANIYYIDTGAVYQEDGLGKLSLLTIHPSIDIIQFDMRELS